MAQYERLEADAPELEFRSFLGDESQQQGDARPAQTGPSRGWTDQSTRTGPAPIWSIDYHQKWFDVDTATASPIHSPTSSLSLMTYTKPDLYGPFWTLTTVIFALYVFSSFAASITSYLSAEPFTYDFALLSVGVSLVYAYGFGTPFVLWGALRYLGTEWSIVEGFAVWGYGMAVWIPVASNLNYWVDVLTIYSLQALCIIPIPILRWVLVGLAFGSSGWYITRNVYPVLASADQKPARLIIVALAALHAAIALTFKVLFFSYYIVPAIGGKEPLGGTGPGKNSTRILL
ncbi:Protein YIPF1 [Ceratobasidium theobromae]|uniref:Protein YIP n=1 Tax=Ceratobasidium theobromae TaxID=1582974 RepID=A0A5N5QEQ0_9AGAM|nr:Protein YIPF1 [Ceratobasidium theobromae]